MDSSGQVSVIDSLSKKFQGVKHFVSLLETLCFIAWNTLCQRLELMLKLLITNISCKEMEKVPCKECFKNQ